MTTNGYQRKMSDADRERFSPQWLHETGIILAFRSEGQVWNIQLEHEWEHIPEDTSRDVKWLNIAQSDLAEVMNQFKVGDRVQYWYHPNSLAVMKIEQLTTPQTIYTQEPGKYHVQKTVGGYVVVFIEDRHHARAVDGGKVHQSRQNAYAKARRLNDAMLVDVEQAAQALAERKVVLVDMAGLRVRVNALSHEPHGWVMSWSHENYPTARIDTIQDDQFQFIVRGEYSSYR